MAIIDYKIVFAGKSNQDYDIVLQNSLSISAAEPNVQIYNIPGRNGDVIDSDGTFKNRTATVSAYIYKDDMVRQDMGKVYEWLFANQGYQELTTDDDPTHFMLARVVSAGDIADRIKKLIPFDIVFDCKPQRFLLTGKNIHELRKEVSSPNYASYDINNPTAFEAQPKLIFYSDFDVEINNRFISLSKEDFGEAKTAIYDSETQVLTLYDVDGREFNYFSYDTKITLKSGKNTINFKRYESNGTMNMQIEPRWWEL